MKKFLLGIALLIFSFAVIADEAVEAKRFTYGMTTNCVITCPNFSRQTVRIDSILIDYGIAMPDSVTNYVDFVVDDISYLWKTLPYDNVASQAFVSTGGLRFIKGANEKIILRSTTNRTARVTVTYVY